LIAVDDASRKYTEITPFEDRSNEGIANAMRVGAKEKVAKLNVKMGKLLAVANLVLSPAFLEEVLLCYLIFCILLDNVSSHVVYGNITLATNELAGGEALDFKRRP